MPSATAGVRMMTGAIVEAVVISIPSHPAKPMPVTMELATMSSVAMVPVTERSVIPMMARIAKNITGTRVEMSSSLASA